MSKPSNFLGAPRTMTEARFQSSFVEAGAAIERPAPRAPGLLKWAGWCAFAVLALVFIAAAT